MKIQIFYFSVYEANAATTGVYFAKEMKIRSYVQDQLDQKKRKRERRRKKKAKEHNKSGSEGVK